MYLPCSSRSKPVFIPDKLLLLLSGLTVVDSRDYVQVDGIAVPLENLLDGFRLGQTETKNDGDGSIIPSTTSDTPSLRGASLKRQPTLDGYFVGPRGGNYWNQNQVLFIRHKKVYDLQCFSLFLWELDCISAT